MYFNYTLKYIMKIYVKKRLLGSIRYNYAMTRHIVFIAAGETCMLSAKGSGAIRKNSYPYHVDSLHVIKTTGPTSA